MSRPLPVNVNTAKLPYRQKIFERVDESLTVVLRASNVGERVLSRTRVSELEPTDANPLRDAAWQSHELLVDIIIRRIHHADLESLWVDRGEGKHDVGDAGEVKLI